MATISLNKIEEKIITAGKTIKSKILPASMGVSSLYNGLCPTGTYIPDWDNFYGSYTCHWLNTDLSRWNIIGNVSLSSEQVFRGSSSIKIADAASFAEHEVIDPIKGTPIVQNVTCRFRFYDTGEPILKTFCGLISSTEDKIMLGVDTSISPDYYVVLHGFISRITTIPRAVGWHDIVFGSDIGGSAVMMDEIIPVEGYLGGVIDVAKIRVEGGPSYYDEIKMFDLDKHTVGTNAMVGFHDFGIINPGESRSDKFYARGYINGNFGEFYDPASGIISISEGEGLVPASWVSGYPTQMEYYWEEITGPYILYVIPFTITVPLDAILGDYNLQFTNCVSNRYTSCGGTSIGVFVGALAGGGIARISDFTNPSGAIKEETINLCSGNIWNDGTSDTLFVKLIDRDDDSIVVEQDFPLSSGDSVPFSITDVMPLKNYNLRLEVGHYVGGDPTQPSVDDFREFAILLFGAGKVSGFVRDPEGIAISSAYVEVNGYTTYTAIDGSYLSPSIPSGNYTITISATGYETISEPITIIEDQEITKDFTLYLSPEIPEKKFPYWILLGVPLLLIPVLGKKKKL